MNAARAKQTVRARTTAAETAPPPAKRARVKSLSSAGQGGEARVRTMSDEHRHAIQSARVQTKTVRAYLEALENRHPRRGARPNPSKMQERITAIEAALETADPLERVNLHQERLDLAHQLETLEQGDRFENLEEAFVTVAAEYSKRRGISSEAWLAVGVSKTVLKRAGVV